MAKTTAIVTEVMASIVDEELELEVRVLGGDSDHSRKMSPG